MIALDTTVLVYAKGADHPLRDSCRRLILAIGEGKIEATTSVEVIQEFAHVRARRRGRDDATSAARDYTQLLSPLLPVTAEHLNRGLAIFERTSQLGAFDAVLAAAALASGATALISADSDFAEVQGLTHIRPTAEGLADLPGWGG